MLLYRKSQEDKHVSALRKAAVMSAAACSRAAGPSERGELREGWTGGWLVDNQQRQRGASFPLRLLVRREACSVESLSPLQLPRSRWRGRWETEDRLGHTSVRLLLLSSVRSGRRAMRGPLEPLARSQPQIVDISRIQRPESAKRGPATGACRPALGRKCPTSRPAARVRCVISDAASGGWHHGRIPAARLEETATRVAIVK